MPYTADNPPEAIEGLPEHAIEIWVSAYNSAFKQYNGDEGKSAATAWAAVKKSYKQVDGKWVAKEALRPHGNHTCACPVCTWESSVATNVKCNTQKCSECGSPMVANQAGERREAMNLSDENKKNLLQSALITEYKIKPESSIPKNLVIDEVFTDKVIYDVDGQLYEANYELGEDGKATFSDPKRVSSTRVFKPMESLQTAYSEIIQEAGRRNASLDSIRLKKIVALCQELLSSEEEPDEKKSQEALKGANKALVWLREQAAMKTEEGEQYPASAFAYAPDIEKSSTWKLRLWEDLEKKVTRAQLGRAAAALSPGGFNGQKTAIPSADMSAVKRKIRAEYRKLEVADEDMPRWVQEALTRDKYPIYTPLTEAVAFDDKGRATVIVIKAGFNADKSRYYPAEMLKRDFKVFEGLKMYADHPTETEEKELPERSMKSWGFVAKLIDVTCDENGTVAGVADIIEDWLMRKLANMREKGMLDEMGISINALGRGSKATIEGVETIVIEELTGGKSVDFVTEPGANGIVTLYESDRDIDVDLIELPALKEKRPDLVKLIEANVRAEIQLEGKHKMELEEKVTELEGQVTTLTTERDDLKTKITEAEKAKAKAEAQATIKEAVDQAELPVAAKERLIERWKDAEAAEGIVEAIQSEVDYIAKLSESGVVKNLGVTQGDAAKDREALKESIRRNNPEYSDAQLKVAVDGR